ncbi:Thiamine thiazole synthase [Methanosarcinaceae archaeon Ag5]|uniref:Thiamine thiazole synthase n=1 Tax=Methanolapillus africanus TaxID=3028297 RepID=A0AAE4SE58_9EURY|nr:Thiamine thiazole synthase [Methanosarcinaceae archaeon Ag5]
MSEKIDIAVIGASPAGLMAARYAAMGGANVKLFERKERIGDDPHPANSFFKGMLSYTGEKVDSSYVVHEIDGMKLVSPGGHTITVETPGYAIDKTIFDRFYEQKTIKAGVDIQTGTEVLDVKRKEDGVTLKIKPVDRDEKEKIKVKLVIIADGILSKNAKAAGLNTMKHPEDIAWGTELEIHAPGSGIGDAKFAEYYVGSLAPGWKTSYLPRGGDNAAIGAYVRYFGKDVSQFLNPWVEKFKELKGLSDDQFEIVTSKSAGDPIVTIPDKIYGANVMVVGGAAGQSGIGYAMRAGQIAGDVGAKAVAKDDFSEKTLSGYHSQWKKDLSVEHTFGRVGLETLRKMDDTEIDELFEVFENEDISSMIKGSAMDQGLSVLELMLKKKPSAILKAGAYFRNR